MKCTARAWAAPAASTTPSTDARRSHEHRPERICSLLHDQPAQRGRSLLFTRSRGRGNLLNSEGTSRGDYLVSLSVLALTPAAVSLAAPLVWGAIRGRTAARRFCDQHGSL